MLFKSRIDCGWMRIANLNKNLTNLHEARRNLQRLGRL
jgi:hypothetical protein